MKFTTLTKGYNNSKCNFADLKGTGVRNLLCLDIVVSKNKVRLEHSYKVRSKEKGIHVLCSGFCMCR